MDRKSRLEIGPGQCPNSDTMSTTESTSDIRRNKGICKEERKRGWWGVVTCSISELRPILAWSLRWPRVAAPGAVGFRWPLAGRCRVMLSSPSGIDGTIYWDSNWDSQFTRHMTSPLGNWGGYSVMLHTQRQFGQHRKGSRSGTVLLPEMSHKVRTGDFGTQGESDTELAGKTTVQIETELSPELVQTLAPRIDNINACGRLIATVVIQDIKLCLRFIHRQVLGQNPRRKQRHWWWR